LKKDEKGWKPNISKSPTYSLFQYYPILSNIYHMLPPVLVVYHGLSMESMVPPWINSASASSARRCASDSWASKASMPQFDGGKNMEKWELRHTKNHT